MKTRFIFFVSLFFLTIIFLFPNNVLAANDLTMDSVTFEPVQPLVNQTTKIIIKIKNIGSTVITNNLAVNNLAFSHNDFQPIVSSEAGSSINPSVNNPLTAGSYFTYTIVGKFLSAGTKTLVLKIDGANYLTESNEDNNIIMPKVDVLKAGDLIKLSNDSAIYKIDTDGKKHLYVNSPTFWSYHTGSWSALKLNGTNVYIQTISQTAFDSIPVGKNMVVKSGARLIKFQNSPQIYTVFGYNKLKLMTESRSLELYGIKWRDRLITIQNGFESDYLRSDADFVDSDGDGLADEDERNIYQTNPSKSDTDGDSYKDGIEVLNGYNPNGSGKL